MAGSERKANLAAGSKTRVQGVTTAQTVKTGATILQSIVIANADVAAQTLTVLDGATMLVVVQVPSKDTRIVPFNVQLATSLVLTPSSTNIDALALYD